MSFFIECFLRVSAIFLVAFLVSLVLRKQAAALRHLIWVAAFGIALLTPLLFVYGPKTARPVIMNVPVLGGTIATPPTQELPRDLSPRRKEREAPPLLIWRLGETLFSIWAAGVTVFAFRMARSAFAASKLRRAAEPTDIAGALSFGLPNGVTVAESEAIAVAMTLGIHSPLILLPSNHNEWMPSRLRAVLLHELAHVRRKDCLLQWLPQIVCALHWFNPLVWLARAQMLCESERACDDAVLLDGASGPGFARDLLAIAEFSGLKGADPMLITVTTRLERRITRLLDPSANRNPLTFTRASATLAVMAALLLPIGAIGAQDGTQTGTLSGIVSDPTVAVIANATVYVSGPAGNLAIAGGPIGAWTARNLPPGLYQVEVSVPGFAAFRQTNVKVDPGASVELRQRLSIGQIAERITVVGAATSQAPANAPLAAPRKIRVGGNVQAARLISKTNPVYPDSAQQQGVQAAVLIQAIIDKNGNVLNPRVISSDTPADLAESALAAVRTWQYEPTRLNGEPVEVITTITVNFQLR